MMFDFLERLRQKKAARAAAPETTELSDKAEDAAKPEPIDVTKNPLNKGKKCINNGKVNKYIDKDAPIPDGWFPGGKRK